MANDGVNEGPGDMVQSQTPRETSPAIRRPAVGSRWQDRLLPFLVGSLGILTVFFCVTIAWETRYIQSRMESALEIDLRPAVSQEFRANGTFLLEADLIERRYRAANVAALSRIYLVFLGFGTGMVLALVGATFVLGKISEPETSIDGAGASFKASLRSGSPGIILAFFGTALMLATIYSKTDISVSDRAVYMGDGSEGARSQADAQSKKPEESKMPEPGKLENQGSLAGAQKSAPAKQPTLEAKNDSPSPDVHLVMATRQTLDGDYNLESHSEPGTLSIRGHEIHFVGRDGKKKAVNVKLIDQYHVVFSVLEPDGGRQDFDGFLASQGEIAGSTSYHGSYFTTPEGFTATRIEQK